MTSKPSQPSAAAFARKYRPQSFDDVVGQEAVSVTLKNALSGGTPAHAYLFFGPRGIGKTTTARILAKALNCAKGPTAEPCGKCVPCSEIAQSSAIDVLELDAATHTQVEKIREMILETVALAPARDRYKVFIIDEVHMLSASSFNALLKTLEEPPAHVVFILATTEPAKIPATIVSRCQRFRFRPVPVQVLAEHLGRLAGLEKIKAEPAALDLLARAAGGSLRDAVSLLDQAQAYAEGPLKRAQVIDLLGTLSEEALLGLTEAVLGRDAKALAERLEAVLSEGYEPAQLVRDLRDRLHAAYLFRIGVTVELESPWKALAEPRPAPTFHFLVGRMNRILEQMRQEDSPRLALEQGLFGLLEPAADLRQWVERLEALEQRLASGAPPAPFSSGGEPRPAGPAGAARPVGGEPRPSPSAAARPAAGPAALPAQPAAAAPAAGTVRAGSPQPAENVWPAVIGQFRQEKPGLASYLEAARLVPAEGPEWQLVFRRSGESNFQMEQAKRNLSLLEAKVASLAGRPVRLKIELGEGARKDDGDSPVITGEPEPAEAAEAESPEDPGVRRVLEVFPGKVRHVKKKP